jgi:uncharacterized protein (DUF58 family)
VDRDELHARIRRLAFASSALSASFTRGEFRSSFKGRGLEFDALRDYSPGEDARTIDWRASARFARPYVRTWLEDRSLSLFLLLDVSASMEAGAGELSKRDMGALALSLLARAAALRDMPVGGLLFAASPLRRFAPRRGTDHALALAEAAISLPELGSGSGLAGALLATSRLLQRRSMVILISDFHAEGWGDGLALLSRKHDLIAIRVTDALDREPPAAGAFPASDAEGGGPSWLPFRSRLLRERWKAFHQARGERARRRCVEARVPLLELDTAEDPALKLISFFDRRRAGR